MYQEWYQTPNNLKKIAQFAKDNGYPDNFILSLNCDVENSRKHLYESSHNVILCGEHRSLLIAKKPTFNICDSGDEVINEATMTYLDNMSYMHIRHLNMFYYYLCEIEVKFNTNFIVTATPTFKFNDDAFASSLSDIANKQYDFPEDRPYAVKKLYENIEDEKHHVKHFGDFLSRQIGDIVHTILRKNFIATKFMIQDFAMALIGERLPSKPRLAEMMEMATGNFSQDDIDKVHNLFVSINNAKKAS